MIANMFNNLHKRGFNEFDLLRFKKWTENFRLSSVLKKKNEDHKQWMFNLVMIDPTSEIFSTKKQHHQAAVEKSRVYNELAAKFFKSMFEKNDVIESKIRLMLSLLLSDGRYEGKCFVVSSFLAQKISIAFAAFVKYKQLLQKQKLNKSKIEDSGLKTEIDLAKTAYADHEEHLIRTVIRRNLGILRRKIIVFPFCN